MPSLIEPRKAEEIAKHCGVSKALVHYVVSTYNRLGVEALETPGKGGRRHEYLSVEEEQHFLTPFWGRAQSDELAMIAEIQQAFEARVGHQVDDSTMYRLLNRPGWPGVSSCHALSIQRRVKTLRISLKKLCTPG